jgi:integrase
MHRQIESLPRVNTFLDSIKRNSASTAVGYKTGLVYFQEILSKRYSQTLETILPLLCKEQIDVYTVLDQFINFMLTEKKVSAVSINQYLNGIRSFLAYYDVYVIPAKFKRKVKVPKVYREEEQPLDAKDIRQILLNCHNRRLKAYLLVLASGGLRAAEAGAIRICDIDFSIQPTKIHVRKEYAKTRVARDIYISNEATKYLKDWINYKHTTNILGNSRSITDNHDHTEDKKKQSDYLIFQVQLNNPNVTPHSIYNKLVDQFQQLLEVAGFSERKEGMKRRKITLHSFRRFVKTIISDCAGKEYSEWFLGHAKSPYYVSKSEVRAAAYADKCMKYLTFLDYATLEVAEKRVEAQLVQKDKEIELMKERFELLQQKQNNDIAELKVAFEFLKNKDNAQVIGDPSSEVISDDRGIPKKIKFSTMTNSATCGIAK